MSSRHHVLALKSVPADHLVEGTHAVLSQNGLDAYRDPKRPKFHSVIKPLAEELEDGRIQLAGAKAPLDLEHSRALLTRTGVLVDDYAELAKPEGKAKAVEARERLFTPGPAENKAAPGPSKVR